MNLEDSKLVLLLKSLNREEFQKLEDYVVSPFFNTSSQIISLFKALKNSYPGFNELDKNFIFKKVCPGEVYKDKKLRDLFSRMLKLAEDFLAQLEFMDRSLLMKSYALRRLAEKNLEKNFISKSKEAEIELSKEKIISTKYFFSKYTIFKEKRDYLETLHALGKRWAILEDITSEIDLFVAYSIYKILKYGLTLQTHEKIVKHKYDLKILNEILDYIKENPPEEYPVIMILYYIIVLNREEGDDSVYFTAKKLLDENMNSFEEEDQRTILTVLFNYTQTQAIKGKPDFRKENYKILKETMEKGLHPMEGKYFPESSYITTVGTALQEKDYSWAEDFMEKYKDKLPPEQKDNAYNYCVSVLNYRKGNYKKALEGLAKVSIEDFYYQIRVKNNEIRIFFELKDYEQVMFQVDSFRHFLGSNKIIPDYLRVRFSNYINFVSRMANALLTNHPKEKLDSIAKEIKDHDSATLENKAWLLQQLTN